MNPLQLRETTMDANTRRLVQLTALDEEHSETIEMMDMLLSKKNAQVIAKNGCKLRVI